MRVTRAEEYGMRLVLSLAAAGEQLTIHDLARLQRLPQTTVAKVVAALRRAGVVRAERGRNGGYELAVPPEELTVAAVVEAFHANDDDHRPCARVTDRGTLCLGQSGCGLRPVWQGLTEVIGGFLAGITVADVLEGRLPAGAELLSGADGAPAEGARNLS